ncbi:MAG: class II glutamine amidotransferase [Polyangiaceae bacterium]
MARLFGLIGNRADLAGRVLSSETDALRVRTRSPESSANGTSSPPWAWGLGFYQGGEVLMRRRPLDESEEIDVAKLASDVRGDIVVGHVRSATVGSFSTENTHPFRSRQWLFAQTGTLDEWDAVRDRLRASIPEFLQSSIRGETDSEIFFHVFLSFLHDAGRLNDAVVEPQAIREALRSSFAVVDGMIAEVSGKPSRLNVLVSNGETIVGVHKRADMAYRVYRGKDDADALLGDDAILRAKTPSPAQMHFVMIASDFDDVHETLAHSRWKKIDDGAIVTLHRGQDPKIEPF